jgi:hypothetical protein
VNSDMIKKTATKSKGIKTWRVNIKFKKKPGMDVEKRGLHTQPLESYLQTKWDEIKAQIRVFDKILLKLQLRPNSPESSCPEAECGAIDYDERLDKQYGKQIKKIKKKFKKYINILSLTSTLFHRLIKHSKNCTSYRI